MPDQSQVAIFWDYENCCPPSTQGLGYDIANNIGHIARVFGSVTTFKAYLDISTQPPKGTTLRSELQLSGVSLIDCPHNGKKEVVDKMVIVDMLAFAVDHHSPATIILIAGDRDYSYAISTLRLRNYNVVLVTPRTTSCLEAQASAVIDWNATLARTRKMPNSELPVRRPYPDLDPDLYARLVRQVTQLGDDDPALCSASSSSEGAIKSRPASTQDLTQPTVLKADNASTVSAPSETGSTRGLPDTPCKPANANDNFTTSATPVAKSSGSPSLLDPAPSRTRSATVHSTATPPQLSKEQEHRHTPSFSVPSDVSLGARDHVNTRDVPSSIGAKVQANGDGPSFPTPIGPPGKPLQTGNSNITHRPPSIPQLNPRLCLSPKVMSPSLKTRTLTGGTPVSFGNSAHQLFSAPGEASFTSLQTPKRQQEDSLAPVLNPYAPNFVPTSEADLMQALGLMDENPADQMAEKDPTPLHQFDNIFLDDHRSTFSTPARSGVMATASASDDLMSTFTPAPEVTRLPLEERSIGSSQGASGSARIDPDGFVYPKSSRGASYQTKLETSYLPAEPTAEATQPSSRLPVESFSNKSTGEGTREHTRAMFLPLIQRLLADRDRGVPRSSRSEVAIAITKADKNVYRRAGVTTFKEYTALAQQASLVVLGGNIGDTWITLHPNWHNAVLPAGALPVLLEKEERESCVPGAVVDSTPVDIDPGCFQPLVGILMHLRQSGQEQLMRSQVGQMLGAEVYRNAGVTSFKDYVARAVERRIVVCGGQGGSAWIRLHPDVGA